MHCHRRFGGTAWPLPTGVCICPRATAGPPAFRRVNRTDPLTRIRPVAPLVRTCLFFLTAGFRSGIPSSYGLTVLRASRSVGTGRNPQGGFGGNLARDATCIPTRSHPVEWRCQWSVFVRALQVDRTQWPGSPAPHCGLAPRLIGRSRGPSYHCLFAMAVRFTRSRPGCPTLSRRRPERRGGSSSRPRCRPPDPPIPTGRFHCGRTRRPILRCS